MPITKRDRKAAEDVASLLAKYGPIQPNPGSPVAARPEYNPFHLAFELLAIARRLNRYNEVECNVGLTERQQKTIARLERQVRDMLPPGVGVKFNGDPRGYAVKLLFPGGEYNTWGGKEEGWGI